MEKKRRKKSNIRFEWETEADKILESESGDGGSSLFKFSFMTSSILEVFRLRRENKCTGSRLSNAQLPTYSWSSSTARNVFDFHCKASVMSCEDGVTFFPREA